ncbi:MAG: ATP-binding protein [Candidatus Cloacimonetes bacterium]|nr:ATP-binding protein [Candidatus Cloacimonadota bacterium]MDD3097301.1 ATP-binding protein [Candidatus Cloacimonadota bacterium]MDY0336692.1 ATP-binding protein [Candidatus Cloacimonadaceae bacterium]
MIISFSMQNFRSIREKVTLDFRATSDKHQEEYFVVDIPKPRMRILKIAMIYGANASGKTSILLALDFLRKLVIQPQQDKNAAIGIPAFARENHKTSFFELGFWYKDIVYNYQLSILQNAIQSEELFYYPKGKRAEVFIRKLTPGKGYEYHWNEKLFKKSTRDMLELTIQNQTILARIASIEDSSPLQDAHDWFRFKLQPILLPNMSLLRYTNELLINQGTNQKAIKQFLLDLLSRADLWINDIDVNEEVVDASDVPVNMPVHFLNPPKPNAKPTFIKYDFGFVHKLDNESYTLDMKEESMGTQRFYGLGAILLSLIRGRVTMPIDEIESSLHNDLLFHFIAMFLRNSRQGQLIFTSHNTALLNEKAITRRDCIWITDRKSDGSTELTPVSDYPVRKEHAIDSLYRKGLLGGKPNLGSNEL